MLIGLTGAAGAGKDSAAAVLCSAGWHSVAYADALRIEVAAAWRVDVRLLTDRQRKEAPQPALCVGHGMDADWLRYAAVHGYNLLTPRSPRWVLQQWGSWRRQQDPQHWIRHVMVWISHELRNGNRNLVVTDVRHENEAQALRQLGGHIVRVHRPGLAALPPDTAGHESEQHGQIRADADLYNAGELRHLAAEVWRVVQDLPPVAAAA